MSTKKPHGERPHRTGGQPLIGRCSEFIAPSLLKVTELVSHSVPQLTQITALEPKVHNTITRSLFRSLLSFLAATKSTEAEFTPPAFSGKFHSAFERRRRSKYGFGSPLRFNDLPSSSSAGKCRRTSSLLLVVIIISAKKGGERIKILDRIYIRTDRPPNERTNERPNWESSQKSFSWQRTKAGVEIFAYLNI